MEKNAGGYDRIAHAVLGPVPIAVEAASLMSFLTIMTGTLRLITAVTILLVGAVLVTTAATQECPPNDLLDVNTCEGATATETGSAGRPRTQ